MSARSFVWLSIGGGAWSLGANWNDTTDGISPSLSPPGAADSVTIGGPTGTSLQTITGAGQAAAALFTGNTLLSGTFSLAALTLGQISEGGLLELAASTALSSTTANIVSGSLLVNGAALSVTGSLALGDAASGSSAALNVTSNGRASVASLFLVSGADGIYVDPTSVLEVGGGTAGVAGQLTIDTGAALSGQGNANAYGTIANNGTIEATSGTLALGRLSGTGTLLLDSGATLLLNAPCGAGQSVSFAGTNATLALSAEFDAPSGPVGGFATGDAFDIRGSTISLASYQSSGTGNGVLTLYYGSQVADGIQLLGDYTGAVFLTSGDGAGGTLITVAGVAPGSGKPSPGTPTPDQYMWTGGATGKWNLSVNWSDVTRHQTVSSIPPGVNDLVSIAGGASAFTVISGPANAATLGITGDVALSGTYAVGTLTAGTPDGTAGTLDLISGSSIAAQSALIADGAISVAGSLSKLSVSGTLALGGGASGVGLPVTALSATAGGTVQAASLTLGGGSGDSIITDPTGVVEVGTAGGAAAGAVTVDAGAALSGNGSVNPFGNIVDNGSIVALGGTLTLGTVGGGGTLTVAAGAALELLGATACPITLAGSAIAGGSMLAFANARVAPSGTITGFVAGDAIRLEGSQLTSVSFAQSSGVLSLIYGNTAVARLTLAGSFTNQKFVLAPDGANGTLIELTNVTGGGGSPGQSGTDTLAWTNPVSGGWSRAGSWTDVTTGRPAGLPPGAANIVQIAGPGSTGVADISGAGTCASLALSGNLLLSGTYGTGQLALAQGAAVVLNSATALSAANATVDGASLVASGAGAALSVAGTLALTDPGAVLSVQAKASAQCAVLSLGDSSDMVAVDPTAWLDVGSTGFTALGAVTIDASAEVTGAGSLNLFGGTIDNGTIAATGGTLALGSVSGTGQITIGTGATLVLTAGEPCPIMFSGGAATLELAGTSLPAGIIAGFAQGDAILFADTPIDSVVYQAGAGGLGTLSVSEAGQTLGQLSVSGNYAGQVWGVQPSGAGAEITLSAPGKGNVPVGTATPDPYVWTGIRGSGWSDPGNWVDTTQGQGPASVAPGLNDLVTITGGNGAALTVNGPADAAQLSLAGTVSLQGGYSVGTLAVSGVLALAAGGTLEAGTALVSGAVALGGGVLVVDGRLALAASGALVAAGGGLAAFGSLTMAAASALGTDGLTGIEIGGRQGAAAGTVTIDADGAVAGAGALQLSGAIVDQGTITASGGTLTLGNLSGSGSLVVGVGATLSLQGTVGTGMGADFAGGGTLLLGQAAMQVTLSLSGFGTGDSVVLQTGVAADAVSYVETAPGTGTVFIDQGGQVIAQLTLLGDMSGFTFHVAGAAGGATILTATPDKTSGQGGGYVSTSNISDGPIELNTLIYDLQQDLTQEGQNPDYAITALSNLGTLQLNTEVYGWLWDGQFAPDGSLPVPNLGVFQGVEIVAPIPATIGNGVSPGGSISLAPGFKAILLEGSENLLVKDSVGGAMMIGNNGADTLVATAYGDTLVGAPGGTTTFTASLAAGASTGNGYDVTMVGGGNDAYYLQNDIANITTSNGHSTVFVGGSGTQNGYANSVVLNGADTVISNGGVVNVTVQAATNAGRNVLYGSANGLLHVVEGNTPSLVIGSQGELIIQGGAASGGQVWGDDSNTVLYTGGSGSALVVAGSGTTQVMGGSGALTVFGGTGDGHFGGAGDTQVAGGYGSDIIVGGGPSTVRASAGVNVWVSGGAPVTVFGSDGASAVASQSFGNILFAGKPTNGHLPGQPDFSAGTGNETLWGGTGNDTFVVGNGKNVLATGGGADKFIFDMGQTGGTDAVIGFVSGQDVLALHGYAAAPQITFAYGSCIVNLTDGTQVVLFGVTSLSPSSIAII